MWKIQGFLFLYSIKSISSFSKITFFFKLNFIWSFEPDIFGSFLCIYYSHTCIKRKRVNFLFAILRFQKEYNDYLLNEVYRVFFLTKNLTRSLHQIDSNTQTTKLTFSYSFKCNKQIRNNRLTHMNYIINSSKFLTNNIASLILHELICLTNFSFALIFNHAIIYLRHLSIPIYSKNLRISLNVLSFAVFLAAVDDWRLRLPVVYSGTLTVKNDNPNES